MRHLRLQFGQSHLHALSKSFMDGVIELVWNSIDAEARHVAVDVVEVDGAVREVRVTDDGHGIDLATAEQEFGVLGDSWKAAAPHSKNGERTLHGRAGEGRLSVFKHGGTAHWRSVSELGGAREELTITVSYPEIEGAQVSDPNPTTKPPGTVVTLSNFAEPPAGLGGEAAYDRLLTTFAVSTQVQDVSILVNGRRLDPSDALLHEEHLDIRTNGQAAALTFLAWNRKIKPDAELHLCDEAGISLHASTAQVEGHGVSFAAYLRWPDMPKHRRELSTAGLHQGELGNVVRAANRQLQSALDRHRDRRRREVIENWKKEGFYPFSEGPPATECERVTRDTFDLVAVEAAAVIDSSRGRSARKLSLRLLKEALERNPSQIHRVLEQVLDLDAESVARLDRLLTHTPLSRLIGASAAIADRLEFLSGLRELTADRFHRNRLLERSQLHKMIASESWVLGEEYALAASDRSLTEVLEQHLQYLDRDALAVDIPKEVLDSEGRRAIVDLLLARRVATADDQKTMLVVELKRPSVAIGDKEYDQLRRYAMAVVDETRFDLSRTKFEFWAISTSISKSMRRERENHGPNLGLVKAYSDLPVRLWVKTWAEVLHTAEHRLKYVQDQLEYEPSGEQSFDYLRRMHADRLPPTVAHATG
jgi:hypothetical protein